MLLLSLPQRTDVLRYSAVLAAHRVSLPVRMLSAILRQAYVTLVLTQKTLLHTRTKCLTNPQGFQSHHACVYFRVGGQVIIVARALSKNSTAVQCARREYSVTVSLVSQCGLCSFASQTATDSSPLDKAFLPTN